MLDTQNQGPQCTACGSPMRLTAIEPSTVGQDLRTFTLSAMQKSPAARDEQCRNRGLGIAQPEKRR
jgi:hypothetical protein